MSKFILLENYAINLNLVSHFAKVEYEEGEFNFHIKFYADGTKNSLMSNYSEEGRDETWDLIKGFIKSSKKVLVLPDIEEKKPKKKKEKKK